MTNLEIKTLQNRIRDGIISRELNLADPQSVNKFLETLPKVEEIPPIEYLRTVILKQ
jgi:hypothetical protein